MFKRLVAGATVAMLATTVVSAVQIGRAHV